MQISFYLIADSGGLVLDWECELGTSNISFVLDSVNTPSLLREPYVALPYDGIRNPKHWVKFSIANCYIAQHYVLITTLDIQTTYALEYAIHYYSQPSLLRQLHPEFFI